MPSELSRPRLLVVEDDEATRESLVVLLNAAGFDTTPAANGQQALDLLQSGPRPDLILLDMLMPLLDGWHLLQQLRPWLSRSPAIPIIVLTGTILTPEWAQDHGCATLLRKPVETEHLLMEIRRCLGEAGRR